MSAGAAAFGPPRRFAGKIPALVGSRLPSPYQVRARIQSFQAVTAPFPGDSRAAIPPTEKSRFNRSIIKLGELRRDGAERPGDEDENFRVSWVFNALQAGKFPRPRGERCRRRDDGRRSRLRHGDRPRPREIVIAVEFVRRLERGSTACIVTPCAGTAAPRRRTASWDAASRPFGPAPSFRYAWPFRGPRAEVGSIDDPTTNSDSQKENCVKFENANDARILQDRAPKSTPFESGNYLSSLGVTSFIPPVSRSKTNARMITSDGIQGCDLSFSTCFCVVKSTSE